MYKNEYHPRYVAKYFYQFGLTKHAFESLLEVQGGVCAICGGEFERDNRLEADHDHTSGLTRGLLCRSCNVRLGKWECGQASGNLDRFVAYVAAPPAQSIDMGARFTRARLRMPRSQQAEAVRLLTQELARRDLAPQERITVIHYLETVVKSESAIANLLRVTRERLRSDREQMLTLRAAPRRNRRATKRVEESLDHAA